MTRGNPLRVPVWKRVLVIVGSVAMIVLLLFGLQWWLINV